MALERERDTSLAPAARRNEMAEMQEMVSVCSCVRAYGGIHSRYFIVKIENGKEAKDTTLKFAL